MKQDYTLYIYKADKRMKTSERRVSTTVWRDQTELGMKREASELLELYPEDQGYRMEWFPTMKTVRNLMTGLDQQIDRDTPWSCNPASETYWSK